MFYVDFNDDEVCDFVQMTEEKNVDVRFIEYMPFTGNKWEMEKLVSYKEMVEKIRAKWPTFAPLENGPNDTSKVSYLTLNELLITLLNTGMENTRCKRASWFYHINERTFLWVL